MTRANEVLAHFLDAFIEGLDPDGKAYPMVVVAGPNGSGKSTFWHHVVKPRFGGLAESWEYLNADDLVREELGAGVRLDSVNQASLKELQLHAQSALTHQRRDLISNEPTNGFVYETVFSDPQGEKVKELEQGAEQGFLTVGVLVCADSIDVLIERVSRRAADGDHGVDVDRQRARYPRVLENMKKALKVLDLVVLVDNSTDDKQIKAAFRAVAVIQSGQVTLCADQLPSWARDVLNSIAPSETTNGAHSQRH